MLRGHPIVSVPLQVLRISPLQAMATLWPVIAMAFLSEVSKLSSLSDQDSDQKRNNTMAKGMTKRRRDEKKPKKEVVKVIAAAPSMKNAVAINIPKAKSK
jgi:hypothetical protein